MYDFVFLQFQVNLYAGLKFEAYPSGQTANRDNCSGSHPVLYYETFYGVNAQFRVEQLKISNTYTLNPACASADYKCFGGRTSSDSLPLQPGNTVMRTTDTQCMWRPNNGFLPAMKPKSLACLVQQVLI